MKDGSNISQETLNIMMAKILESEDLIEKLEKKILKKGSEVFHKVFGVEAKLKINEQKIIWADKDSILVVGNLSGQVDGTEIKEVYATSTTALGGMALRHKLNGKPKPHRDNASKGKLRQHWNKITRGG